MVLVGVLGEGVGGGGHTPPRLLSGGHDNWTGSGIYTFFQVWEEKAV